MSNSKLLLTTAISLSLAIGPAQASPSFAVIPHSGASRKCSGTITDGIGGLGPGLA